MNATLDLDVALSELAAELRAGIPEMIERGLAQMRRELPEFFVRDDDPDFVEIYRRSYEQQLRFIYDGLERGRDLDASEIPPPAVEEARLSANFGIKLGSVLLGYRVTHRLIFDEAIDRAGERIDDPDLRAAVLRVTSPWLFAYIDLVTARVTEVYERERESLVRDSERRRRQLVRDLLDGQSGRRRRSCVTTLDREHLGLVAWGDDPERALDGDRATRPGCRAADGRRAPDTTASGLARSVRDHADELRGRASSSCRRAFASPIGEQGRGVRGISPAPTARRGTLTGSRAT